MTIAGKPISAADWTEVENPARAEVFAKVPSASGADVDAAVSAATDAAADWAGLSQAERQALLRACGDALAGHLDEVAALVTQEQGKPLRDARAEVGLSADWFHRTAELSLDVEELVRDEAAHITAVRVPHGPVASVAPSNFPVILAVTKIAPALLAGNTVVLKPSPLTPLSGLRMAEVFASVLPPGVLNTVSGGAETGTALVTHPGIRMVSFTGSDTTGRAIARAASSDLRHVVLELGGNDACLILPGTDVSAVAPGVFAAAMRNCGQFCAAVKRVYVSRDQAAQLVDALAAEADSVALGDGLDPTSDLGPLVSGDQRAKVSALVAAAERAGGTVVRGGRAPRRPGYFFAPTIMTDLPPGTDLEQEEQFGPVIPVIAYDSVPEAVARANGTRFGLGGSVWGPVEAARAVGAELECGTVWINTHGDLRHDVPFGGHGQSGVGLEYGYWGLLEYTRVKVLNVAKGPAA
ncbi:aldehyde dehydrogenase family protein [Streptomyces europaeiscabiei]|uniref:aldehyde dehydrogenase family protein n=1 Tax=Streptomyces europaeiscabiei TaxID=146819 RepID=UPI0029A07775|nr:aldehyde dehydrogenase family protein [Streptomyces europaeiscabiei]MDX2525290.1 aldehyde dehydrogenase family protein [Streptomyces europaeiscabiei]